MKWFFNLNKWIQRIICFLPLAVALILFILGKILIGGIFLAVFLPFFFLLCKAKEHRSVRTTGKFYFNASIILKLIITAFLIIISVLLFINVSDCVEAYKTLSETLQNDSK